VKLVVHVATRFLGGGSERSLADVVRALPPSDYEHFLIVGRNHDPTRVRSLLGDTKVLVIDPLIRRPDPVSDVKAYIQIRAAIRRLRPDIVHTMQSKSGILGRAATRSVGTPALVHSVVMSNFGSGFHPAASAVYRAAERIAAPWTDGYIACGEDVRDRFVRAGIATPSRYAIVRSSVDAALFRTVARLGRVAARGALGIDENGPLVLFAGALEERKGVHDLVPFLKDLRKIVPDARLLVAGEGPLRTTLERAFERAALRSAVLFLGFTDLMAEAMAASDCLVMLSRAEGLATVLVQAVAAGRPFVSYEVDGPREMIARGAIGTVVESGAVSIAANATAGHLVARDSNHPVVDLSEWEPSEVARRYRAEFARYSRR
jgi:glycosyltransferase involved in cell wall biosynthesis